MPDHQLTVCGRPRIRCFRERQVSHVFVKLDMFGKLLVDPRLSFGIIPEPGNVSGGDRPYPPLAAPPIFVFREVPSHVNSNHTTCAVAFPLSQVIALEGPRRQVGKDVVNRAIEATAVSAPAITNAGATTVSGPLIVVVSHHSAGAM